VEDAGTALGGAFERSGVAKIAADLFDVELANGAAGTAQGADGKTAFQQQTGHMPAQKSAGSSY
jgi:hypothetical protein